MNRRRQNLPFLENLLVIDAGAEGKAVAKTGDKVVFIPYAVPGDVVDIQVTAKKKSFLEGKIINFKTYSEIRVEPACEHFGLCGGCKWQMLNYQDQLRFKQKQVVDALTRIGKISVDNLHPIIGNDQPFRYRNKLEFTFSNFRWLENFNKDEAHKQNMNGLGFHKPGMFDRVVDIKNCHLMDSVADRIRNAVRDFTIENNYSFFDLKRQNGLLRNLIVRNTVAGDLMVILVFYENDERAINLIMSFIRDSFKEITSLIYIHNPKANDSISDLEFKVFSGKEYIEEKMTNLDGNNLFYRIGPKSFYQTNSRQAEVLYRKVEEFCNLQGNEIVYDLYTGTGTIANFVAHKAHKVVGIEYVKEAIDDAAINSKLNNISNTQFYAGDMVKVLTPQFVAENGKPDIVITDPPRAGMHQKVVDSLLEMEPQSIVYVSCNPATQARDLALLSNKYSVVELQPVDMFPQTAHVENIALLRLLPSVNE